MVGVGVGHVFGWFPALPTYCFRPSWVALLAVAALALVTLASASRGNTAVRRCTLVAALLVAGSLQTRKVTHCVAEPAVVSPASARFGGQSDAHGEIFAVELHPLLLVDGDELGHRA